MPKKLYVGNLPYKADEEALKNAFSAMGEVVSVRVLTDETGRSKGFGFVEMANDAEAEKAIASLNGSDMLGRAIVVNEARPQTEKRGGPGGGGRGGRPGGRSFGGGGGRSGGSRDRY